MPNQRRTRVKICGITNLQDAQSAVAAGADAIGLVFYDQSPRYVGLDVAQAIARSVGPFVSVVALFVNADAQTIRQVLANVPVHVIQFHGDETDEFCRQFDRPFIKAVRMAPEVDLATVYQSYPNAVGFLLDAYQKGVPGGTGKQFEWHRFPFNPEKPTVLAGGLVPDNVAEAVEQTKPYAVDVSGGVEAEPGVKSRDKMIAFVRAAIGPQTPVETTTQS